MMISNSAANEGVSIYIKITVIVILCSSPFGSFLSPVVIVIVQGLSTVHCPARWSSLILSIFPYSYVTVDKDLISRTRFYFDTSCTETDFLRVADIFFSITIWLSSKAQFHISSENGKRVTINMG